jgi:hypothetical protein
MNQVYEKFQLFDSSDELIFEVLFSSDNESPIMLFSTNSIQSIGSIFGIKESKLYEDFFVCLTKL